MRQLHFLPLSLSLQPTLYFFNTIFLSTHLPFPLSISQFLSPFPYFKPSIFLFCQALEIAYASEKIIALKPVLGFFCFPLSLPFFLSVSVEKEGKKPFFCEFGSRTKPTYIIYVQYIHQQILVLWDILMRLLWSMKEKEVREEEKTCIIKMVWRLFNFIKDDARPH